MKKISLTLSAITLLLFSCGEPNSVTEAPSKPTSETEVVFENEAHELVNKMVQKVGTYADLLAKNDVVYTYTYETPDGKIDVTTEKYMFSGELSYGEYKRHERTLPEVEGSIEQGYNGDSFWVKINDTLTQDEAANKKAVFNRKTNFYWFTMMQKLMDPGVNYEHVGKDTVNGELYDIVKITFDTEENQATDTYQIYINEETGLVDQFLFTVVDYGVVEEPFLMQLSYKTVDGIMIPSQRKYKKSDWQGTVMDTPWIKVTWSDIVFDNGLTTEDFEA